MKPARLPAEMVEILSSVFGQFVTQVTGSWSQNLMTNGIGLSTGDSLVGLTEGYHSIRDTDASNNRGMACWANSGMSMRIPRSIRPGLLFDESFLIYDQGDPRSVTAQEHRVIHHSVIDIEAPRGVPQ